MGGDEAFRDLAGRTFTVRENSSYWETLSKLQNSRAALKLVSAPQTMETNDIIESVASGAYDLTLADEVFVQTSGVRKRLSTPLSLGNLQRYAWAVRSSNPRLKKAVDAFIAKEYRGASYNILRKKYFRTSSITPKNKIENSAKKRRSFSPYDGIIKKTRSRIRDSLVFDNRSNAPGEPLSPCGVKPPFYCFSEAIRGWRKRTALRK